MAMGFIFDYDGMDFGDSQAVAMSKVKKINPKKRNHDEVPLFVRCESCDEYMDFCPGSKEKLDGHWKCSICDKEVDEIRVYEKLNQENSDFLKANDLE